MHLQYGVLDTGLLYRAVVGITNGVECRKVKGAQLMGQMSVVSQGMMSPE